MLAPNHHAIRQLHKLLQYLLTTEVDECVATIHARFVAHGHMKEVYQLRDGGVESRTDARNKRLGPDPHRCILRHFKHINKLRKLIGLIIKLIAIMLFCSIILITILITIHNVIIPRSAHNVHMFLNYLLLHGTFYRPVLRH